METMSEWAPSANGEKLQSVMEHLVFFMVIIQKLTNVYIPGESEDWCSREKKLASNLQVSKTNSSLAP
jgi:hypothetical protein